MRYNQQMKQRWPVLRRGRVQVVSTLCEVLPSLLSLQVDSPGGRQAMLCDNKAAFAESK